ncbi:DUF6879 family protein [Streptomyces sp. NPDC059134]|uniref:DUF6879 family protein n=1 Tax=Streptomyces sp. NPDC059134 TaxID=3346738 RepID=UPI003694365E
MPPSVPPFRELLAGAERTAVHLELRDTYFSNPRFEEWRTGSRVDWSDRSSWWLPFHQQIADAVARGVAVRRARVVSEPVTEYIRWEHYVTRANTAAGEEVRWLPRRQAGDLALAGNDFWLFDGRLLRIHHFSGDGDLVADEITDDAATVEVCATAFDSVWQRAIPHAQYEIH